MYSSVEGLKHVFFFKWTLYKFQKHLDFTKMYLDEINDRISGFLKINKDWFNWIRMV